VVVLGSGYERSDSDGSRSYSYGGFLPEQHEPRDRCCDLVLRRRWMEEDDGTMSRTAEQMIEDQHQKPYIKRIISDALELSKDHSFLLRIFFFPLFIFAAMISRENDTWIKIPSQDYWMKEGEGGEYSFAAWNPKIIPHDNEKGENV